VNERRIRWLLVLILVGQLVFLSAQIRDPAGGGTYLESAFMRLVSPVARMVAGSAGAVSSLSDELSTRRSLIRENRRLRETVSNLRRRQIQAFGVELELERLAEALEYARETDLPLRVADIVLIDHASFVQTLVLRIEHGGVEPNQPVVVGDGLVGRVVITAGPYAKVQLVTDRSASVGAMIQRTRRQGIARGAGGGLLELDFVPLQEDVRPGDRVVTAGIDGIYPRGLPVGTVVAVEPGSGLFHRISLRPAVDLGVLDQVYILESEPVPDSVKELTPDAQP